MICIEYYPEYWRARAAERRRKSDQLWDWDMAYFYEEIANHLSARKSLESCPAYGRVDAIKSVIVYSLPPPVEGECYGDPPAL